MPGIINFDDDQVPNGSNNGQGTTAAKDRPAEHPAEHGESTEPRNLEDDLEISDPFPLDALPPILKRQTGAIAELTGLPSSMVGPLVLSCASASIGRGVRVESYKGHQTRANVYMLVAKQSGSGGSACYYHAMRPLLAFQFRNRREHEETIKPDLEARRIAIEEEINSLRSQLRSGKSVKTDRKALSEQECNEIKLRLGELQAELQQIGKEIEGPLFRTSDCTSEGLVRLLATHGEVLAHLDSDAGDALSSILGKYQQDGVHQSESVWLRSYTGESFTVSRKKEGTMCIREPCLTCCFMATPATVHGLFQIERLSEGGLLGRFHAVNPHARAQEIPEDSANEVRRLPSDVAEGYDAAIWTFLQEYRIKANEEENNHVIGMTPGARLELIRYANSILKQANHKPDPFEARHGEGAIRFALICHLFRHVEVEQRGLSRTYGIKAGSLVGHETDLDIESARAGIQIQRWFVRRQMEFLAPKRIQDEDAIWD
jgi:hypothetical protein